MIQIKKGGVISFDGQVIDRSSINFQDFLIANLSMPITIEEGVTAYDILHMIHEIKDFIYKFHSENYETIRAYFVAGNLRVGIKKIILSKEITIENNFLYISPVMNFSFTELNEEKKLCDVEVEISHIIFSDNNEGELEHGNVISSIISSKLMSDFTLLDLTTCFFYDFPNKIYEIIQL